jgi:hypothetical protein
MLDEIAYKLGYCPFRGTDCLPKCQLLVEGECCFQSIAKSVKELEEPLKKALWEFVHSKKKERGSL